MEEVVLSTDKRGQPIVVRVGATVRRRPGPGSELSTALLQHLEAGGFEGSPRYLGLDDLGRQVLSFVEGEVSDAPTWQEDDAKNAIQLGRIARLLRALHDATSDFVARPDLKPCLLYTSPSPRDS